MAPSFDNVPPCSDTQSIKSSTAALGLSSVAADQLAKDIREIRSQWMSDDQYLQMPENTLEPWAVQYLSGLRDNDSISAAEWKDTVRNLYRDYPTLVTQCVHNILKVQRRNLRDTHRRKPDIVVDKGRTCQSQPGGRRPAISKARKPRKAHGNSVRGGDRLLSPLVWLNDQLGIPSRQQGGASQLQPRSPPLQSTNPQGPQLSRGNMHTEQAMLPNSSARHLDAGPQPDDGDEHFVDADTESESK